MNKLAAFIRREIGAAYDNGLFAANHDVVTTREQIVEVGEERIAAAVVGRLLSEDAYKAFYDAMETTALERGMDGYDLGNVGLLEGVEAGISALLDYAGFDTGAYNDE